MTTKTKLITAILLGAAGLTCQAQTAPAPTAAPPSAFEQFQKEVKHPTDWLTWGADFRPRNEYFNNALSLSDGASLHEQDVIRFRTRVWAAAEVVTNVSLNGRLSAEPREFLKPSFAGTYRGQSGMEWRYGIADNLNVQWKQAFGQPLTVTAGRQDIMMGDFYDWWLVADGTPGDGSWTFFLDSIRAQYELKEIKTKLDLIYIYQNPRPDEWIPTIDDSSDYYLTEQREQGVILYGSNKSFKDIQLDGYFIYKNDNMELRGRGDNADIYTVGGKITGTPMEHLQYSVEGAYQFGSKQEPSVRVPVDVGGERRDIDAFGGKAKLTYLFKDTWNNQVSLIGEYLSGDDPDTTDTDEMFDVLWGRWPRWSELYIYSYTLETGGKIAQLNNVARVGASWSVNPVKKLTFSAMYNALFAPEEVPTRTVARSLFSEDGNFRGHYAQAILKYQFSKNVTAHLWTEFVWQGDYYAQRDLMSFIRGEVLFTF